MFREIIAESWDYAGTHLYFPNGGSVENFGNPATGSDLY